MKIAELIVKLRDKIVHKRTVKKKWDKMKKCLWDSRNLQLKIGIVSLKSGQLENMSTRGKMTMSLCTILGRFKRKNSITVYFVEKSSMYFYYIDCLVLYVGPGNKAMYVVVLL